MSDLNLTNHEDSAILELVYKETHPRTAKDLRRKLNSKFFDKKASDVMTKKPTLIDKDMLVAEALNIMNQKKITSLFVCKSKTPIGIIHIHDLLRLTS